MTRKLAIDAARADERRGARLTFFLVSVLLNVLTASDNESVQSSFGLKPQSSLLE
jgi:hypothetical protein